jgi:hypothetical protein
MKKIAIVLFVVATALAGCGKKNPPANAGGGGDMGSGSMGSGAMGSGTAPAGSGDMGGGAGSGGM